MKKNNEATVTIAPKKLLTLAIALVLIAVSALLCVFKGVLFNTEFGGGAAITVTFSAQPTQDDIAKALNAVKANTTAAVLSVQTYGTDSVMIRTESMADPEQFREAVSQALSINKDLIKAANTDRYVSKDALLSVAYSLLLAGAIALVYFALRFGILAAVGTLFGMIVTMACWLLPYTLFSVLDYKAFTVLSVGLAVFVVENALSYGKKLRKASDVNIAPALRPVLLVTALGVAACVVLGLCANLWSIALPLCFTLVGAAFSSLFATGAFVLMFKK